MFIVPRKIQWLSFFKFFVITLKFIYFYGGTMNNVSANSSTHQFCLERKSHFTSVVYGMIYYLKPRMLYGTSKTIKYKIIFINI